MGSDAIIQAALAVQPISIHAPREGSDLDEFKTRYKETLISIHAPREGSDEAIAAAYTNGLLFLSTLPVRGATHRDGADRQDQGDFYPRSP